MTEMQKDEKEKDLRELRNRQDMLKHHLSMEQDDPHVNIQSFHFSLDQAFSFDKISPIKTPRRHLQMTPDLLRAESVYRRWKSATKSCLLVLAGTTPPEALMNRSTHSWLSEGSLQLAEALTAEHRTVAYYWCHPQDHSEQVSLTNVTENLITQILQHHPHSLKNTASDFEILLMKMRINNDLDTAIKPLKAVFESQDEQTTVYIIVDRLETCACAHIKVIERVLKITAGLSCVVKAFITIDPTFWLADEWKYDKKKLLEMEKESNGRMLSKLDWDQPRDPTKW